MFDSQSKTLLLSFALAIAVHAAVLFGGGLVAQDAVTGTGGGGSAMEVELTEGPPSVSEPAPASVPVPPPPVQPPPEPVPETHPDAVPSDEMVTPETNAVATPATEAPQPQVAATNLYASSNGTLQQTGKTVSDASASGPGGKPGTGGSSGAAWGDPRYGSNPAPVYPLESRQMGQQGTVILSVLVNAQGSVETLAVKESSGHILLDQAAMRAVKRWHFKPATIAGVAVSSPVEVPIEFHLDG